MQGVQSSKNGTIRLSDEVILAARSGDINAITLLQRQFDPYIRRLATLRVHGTSYLNVDLYENLKTRLTIETLKFKPREYENAGSTLNSDVAYNA